MGLRVQEDDSVLLVSGPYHHLPAPGRTTGAVCGIARYCTRCAAGSIDQEREVKTETPATILGGGSSLFYLLESIEQQMNYRMNCIASHASLAGRPGAFSPFVDLSNQAMLRASVRMV